LRSDRRRSRSLRLPCSERAATGHAQEPIRIGGAAALTGPADPQERHRELHRDADRPRHDQRARRGQRPAKVDFLARRHPDPDCRHQRNRASDHQDGVKITLGSGVSLLAVPVSQAAERHGVFHWETAGAADIITKRGFKYTFQVGPRLPLRPGGGRPPRSASSPSARQISRRPAHRHCLWENRAFGKSGGDSIRAYAKEKSVNLVYDEKATTSSSRHDADRPAAEDVKPDVLIAISFPNDAILFQRKARSSTSTSAPWVGVSAG